MKKEVIGKKLYGIMAEDSSYPICIGENKEEVKTSLDSIYTILVELEVTKILGKSHLCICNHSCCDNN